MKAYIKRINFEAELPKDFMILKYIQKSNGMYLLNDPFMAIGRIDWKGKYIEEYFEIRAHENKILFSGSFSSIWIIRIFEKFWEYLFPATYLIAYE